METSNELISNGKLFRSSEHLYQWSILVLIDPDGAENHYRSMSDLDSLKSRKYSHEIQAKSRKPEDAEKLQVMEHVATLKFQQNPPLCEALVYVVRWEWENTLAFRRTL